MPDVCQICGDTYCDCEEEVQYWQVDKICAECGGRTVGERCSQCGLPLCPMCFETGGGFCSACPSEDRPGYPPW
jgi:hypothetical protein